MADESVARVSRRAFLQVSTVGGLALAREACPPASPSGPPGGQSAPPAATQAPAATQPPAAGQPAPTAAAAAAPAKPAEQKPAAGAKQIFPTYVAYKNASLKPDYHLDDPLYSD